MFILELFVALENAERFAYTCKLGFDTAEKEPRQDPDKTQARIYGTVDVNS